MNENKTRRSISSVESNNFIATILDFILAALFFAYIVLGILSINAKVPIPSAIPIHIDPETLKTLWGFVKDAGAIAAFARGGIWLGKTFTGRNKYENTIWDILFEASAPLSKDEIKEKTRERIGNPFIISPFYKRSQGKQNRRDAIFERKFNSAWRSMGKKGIIKNVGGLYSLQSPEKK